jgi:Fe2+ transport system protein FeoA
MKVEIRSADDERQTSCQSPLCPLNRIRAGMEVRVKQLMAPPEIAGRLREIGLSEDRVIRLLTGSANVICLVCNARLALSEQLARTILVEPLLEHVPA